MINIPQIPENINHDFTPNKEEIFETLNEETTKYSWQLDFANFTYKERQKLYDNITDQISDILIKNIFNGFQLVDTLIKEIIKNSVDHADDLIIQLHTIKNNDKKTITLKFTILDSGSGLSDAIIKTHFDNPGRKKGRTQQNKHNRGIGLGMIKDSSQMSNIDLVLHNQGNVIHLNDLGLQKDIKPQEKFGYEGVGTFDIVVK